jgi:excisionase family DNA binding protein
MDKKTYSVDEMAKVLGVSRPTAYALVRSHGFPALHVGRRIVIPIDLLDRGVENQAVHKETT